MLYKFLSFFLLFIFLLIMSCSNDPVSSDTSQHGTLTDIDGNIYGTIKIGKRWWMTENLKVTRFRNGDSIPQVKDASQWGQLSTAAYCDYDNDADNGEIYGRLYNWFAVNDSRHIAPAGWHVATDAEWQQLEMHFGMKPSQTDSIGLRDAGEVIQMKQDLFNVLCPGLRTIDGEFNQMGKLGYWWTATEFCRLNAWYRGMIDGYDPVNRNFDSKIHGFSVRCVKD